jgi:hypothetical protein
MHRDVLSRWPGRLVEATLNTSCIVICDRICDLEAAILPRDPGLNATVDTCLERCRYWPCVCWSFVGSEEWRSPSSLVALDTAEFEFMVVQGWA